MSKNNESSSVAEALDIRDILAAGADGALAACARLIASPSAEACAAALLEMESLGRPVSLSSQVFAFEGRRFCLKAWARKARKSGGLPISESDLILLEDAFSPRLAAAPEPLLDLVERQAAKARLAWQWRGALEDASRARLASIEKKTPAKIARIARSSEPEILEGNILALRSIASSLRREPWIDPQAACLRAAAALEARLFDASSAPASALSSTLRL